MNCHGFDETPKFSGTVPWSVSKSGIAIKTSDEGIFFAGGIVVVRAKDIVQRIVNHESPQRIAINVALASENVFMRIQDIAAIARLKEMAFAVELFVVSESKAPVEIVHELGKDGSATF
jgi:hypothetical protein